MQQVVWVALDLADVERERGHHVADIVDARFDHQVRRRHGAPELGFDDVTAEVRRLAAPGHRRADDACRCACCSSRRRAGRRSTPADVRRGCARSPRPTRTSAQDRRLASSTLTLSRPPGTVCDEIEAEVVAGGRQLVPPRGLARLVAALRDRDVDDAQSAPRACSRSASPPMMHSSSGCGEKISARGASAAIAGRGGAAESRRAGTACLRARGARARRRSGGRESWRPQRSGPRAGWPRRSPARAASPFRRARERRCVPRSSGNSASSTSRAPSTMSSPPGPEVTRPSTSTCCKS